MNQLVMNKNRSTGPHPVPAPTLIAPLGSKWSVAVTAKTMGSCCSLHSISCKTGQVPSHEQGASPFLLFWIAYQMAQTEVQLASSFCLLPHSCLSLLPKGAVVNICFSWHGKENRNLKSQHPCYGSTDSESRGLSCVLVNSQGR